MHEFTNFKILTLLGKIKLAFVKDMQLFKKELKRDLIYEIKYSDLIYFGKFYAEDGHNFAKSADDNLGSDLIDSAYENISESNLKQIPCWWMDSINLPRSLKLSEVRPKIARKFFYILADNLFWTRYEVYENQSINFKARGEPCQPQKETILRTLYLLLGVNPYIDSEPNRITERILVEINSLVNEFDECLSSQDENKEDKKNILIDNQIFFYRVGKLKSFLIDAIEFLNTINIFWNHNDKNNSRVENVTHDVLSKLWDGAEESLANEVRSEYLSSQSDNFPIGNREKEIENNKLNLLYKPRSTFSSKENLRANISFADLKDKIKEINLSFKKTFYEKLPPKKYNLRKAPRYKAFSDSEIWNFQVNEEYDQIKADEFIYDKNIILGKEEASDEIFMVKYDESWSLFIETEIYVPPVPRAIKGFSEIVVEAQNIQTPTNLMISILINLFFKTDPSDVWIMIYDFNSNDFKNYENRAHMPIPIIKNEHDALKSFTYILDKIDKKIQNNMLAHKSKSNDMNSSVDFKTLYIFIKDINDFQDKTLATMINLIAMKGPEAGVNLIVGSQFKYIENYGGVIEKSRNAELSKLAQEGKNLKEWLPVEMKNSDKFIQLRSTHRVNKEYSFNINGDPSGYFRPLYISKSDENVVLEQWKKWDNSKYKLEILGDKNFMQRGYDINEANEWLTTKRFQTNLSNALSTDLTLRELIIEIFLLIEDRKLKTNSSIEKIIEQKLLQK